MTHHAQRALPAQRAMSFGAVAGDYNRLRPGPPPAAVDWLLPARCPVAVDLAAGTGLFTRALASQAGQVVAVEPDRRMGAVLRASTPGAGVVAGTGEALPLRDASADAVLISSAWHWLDPVRAVPEIGRVLRDGGRLGVIWTSRDRMAGWIRLVDQLREPGAGDGDAPQTPPARPPEREVLLPPSSPFEAEETASFTFSRLMRADDFVGWIGTYSRIIMASPADRTATLGRVRQAVRDQFGDAEEIDVPMRARCWRATRTGRGTSAPGRSG